MDVDEYINIHVGDGTLGDLFAAVPDATMIALTWRLFGNADLKGFEDRFITEQLVECAPEICRKPHQAWGFKTAFRNLDHYRKFGVHRPKGLKPEHLNHINWVNGSGEAMPKAMLRSGWRSSNRTIGYDLVTLNHYSLRSAESFLVKRDRGRVNHVDRDQGLAYWFRMNHNKEEDRSIQRMLPRVRVEFDRLMSDPEIAAQHHDCILAHRQRITELMETPDYLSLYHQITGTRLCKLSRMLEQFGTQVFLEGPDSVPADFHWHGTTIVGVRKGGKVVVAGDGQVSLGPTVIKGTATKVRRIAPGGHDVVCGFAGSTADAFTLLERLETKLEAAPGQLARACVELAKDWRTDKYLRNLEAMLIVTDGTLLYVLTGAGDVLEPEHDVAAIGSGGNFALAAARALADSDLDAEAIARKALGIAAEICVYTNGNLTVEVIQG